MGVVAFDLAMPRTCQHLVQEVPASGGFLHCPGVSLVQENSPCTEIFCHSAADQVGSGAAPLSK